MDRLSQVLRVVSLVGLLGCGDPPAPTPATVTSAGGRARTSGVAIDAAPAPDAAEPAVVPVSGPAEGGTLVVVRIAKPSRDFGGRFVDPVVTFDGLRVEVVAYDGQRSATVRAPRGKRGATVFVRSGAADRDEEEVIVGEFTYR